MNLRKLVSGFIYNGLGWLLNAAIAVGVSAVMVRFSGLELYGRYVFVSTVFAVLRPVLNLGVADVMSRYIPEYTTCQDMGKVKWLVKFNVLPLLIVDIVIVALVIGLWVLLEPSYASLVVLVGIWACLNSWQTALAYALNSFYEQGFTNLVIVASNLLMLSGVILAASWRPSVELLVLVSVVTLVPRVIAYSVRLCGRLHGVATTRAVHDWKRIRYYAFYAVLIQITAYVAWQSSESFFLGLFWTNSDVAVYRIAFALPQRLLDFVSAVVGSLGVVAMTQLHTLDPSRLRTAIQRFLKYEVMGAVPICVWIVSWAEWLLHLLYGQSTAAAILPMRILAILYTLTIFNPAAAIIIRVKERMRASLALNLSLATLNVVLDLLLIPSYGLWGAVAATGMTMIAGVVAHAVWGMRMIGSYIPFRELGRLSLAALAMALVYAPSTSYTTHWGTFLGVSALGFIIYAVGLKATGALSDEDYRMLAQVGSSLIKRVAGKQSPSL